MFFFYDCCYIQYKLHVCSPVLGLVDVHAGVVPGELLPRFDALVLGRELDGSLRLQLVNMGRQVLEWVQKVYYFKAAKQ